MHGWWSRLGIILHPALTHERMPLSLQVYIISMVGGGKTERGGQRKEVGWGGGGVERKLKGVELE